MKIASPDEWLQIPVALIGYLSPAEVILLSELLRMRDLSNQKEGSRSICATVEAIESRIRYTEDQQRRTLKSLEEKGFIKTARSGMPPKRWVEIEDAEIAKVVRQFYEERK